MKKIGFIGLGHMGKPMAKNLLQQGFAVSVFDKVAAPVEELEQCGAIVATSIADLAATEDILITMVQTSEQVKDLCLSPEGIFEHAHAKLLYIDSSSIDIAITRELHQIAIQKKIAMLDAPVSGGQAGAEIGTLTFMVGGNKTYFDLAKPIFEAMGKKIIHTGAEGTGQAAKICNNLLLGISMIGVSEAFLLAQKLGLEAKKFYEVSSNASGQCWSMTSYCPIPGILENVPSNRNYEPGFMAKMMLKDLHLGEQASQLVNLNLSLGHLATQIYEDFVQAGYGEKDFSAIVKFLAE